MLAQFRVDPRDDPQYESRMETVQSSTEYWQKTHPGKSMKEKYGPRYQEIMEANVLRDIAFPGKNRQVKQRRSGQSRKSRDTYSGLRDILDLALIFGGGFLLDENIKLKRENEELRRMIAGEATAGEKCGRPKSGPDDDKHEGTPSQSSGWKQQSDPSQP